MSEDALAKFTTFAQLNDTDSVETEVIEAMESDAELVEADTTENDSIEDANLVEEVINPELDEATVVDTEAVVE